MSAFTRDQGVHARRPAASGARVGPASAPGGPLPADSAWVWDNAPGVHPSAVIHPAAHVDQTARVGPYCVVGPGVRVGPGTRLGAHVVVHSNTTLGADNRVHSFATIGHDPQDLVLARNLAPA